MMFIDGTFFARHDFDAGGAGSLSSTASRASPRPARKGASLSVTADTRTPAEPSSPMGTVWNVSSRAL